MLDRLERKFGKYAIRNFSYYILIICIIGSLLGLFNSSIYYNYLALDFDQILNGQIWRLITFIFYPLIDSLTPMSIFFGAISLYLYYYIGNVLESSWGAFRFNIYYISGFLLSILSTLLIYLIFGVSLSFGMKYINNAMFLAFATLMPDNKIMVYFIIPVKMKWMGWLYAGILAYEVFSNILTFTPGGIAIGVAIIISVLNFIVYFIASKTKYKPTKKGKEFRKNVKKIKKNQSVFEKMEIPAHSCCVCGRTNVTNPELSFRYCSKCEEEKEYCSDHIFNHEHITKKR